MSALSLMMEPLTHTPSSFCLIKFTSLGSARVFETAGSQETNMFSSLSRTHPKQNVSGGTVRQSKIIKTGILLDVLRVSLQPPSRATTPLIFDRLLERLELPMRGVLTKRRNKMVPLETKQGTNVSLREIKA